MNQFLINPKSCFYLISKDRAILILLFFTKLRHVVVVRLLLQFLLLAAVNIHNVLFFFVLERLEHLTCVGELVLVDQFGEGRLTLVAHCDLVIVFIAQGAREAVLAHFAFQIGPVLVCIFGTGFCIYVK